MNALANVTVPSGYFCPTPVIFEWQGEAMSRPCGHCARCFAVKKRDLTGRAAAEAVVSEEMVTFTLTYRDGELGSHKWCVQDRQNFIKRIRAKLRYAAIKFLALPGEPRRATARRVGSDAIDAASTRARYFGCGETGERRTKRHHFHIVVFFKHGPAGPSGFVSSKRDKKGRLVGEDDNIWPHGISTIDVHPAHMSLRMSAVRYVSKYITKAALAYKQKKAGREPDALLFRSLKPALGAEYLGQWAEDHAKAALPLPGEYTVPHVTFSRGLRQSVRHRLLGVSRGYVINRYRDAWVRLRPGADVPHSDFLARYDDLHVMRSTGRRRPLGVVRSAPLPPVPRKPVDCHGLLVVRVGARVLGVVQTLWTGVAIWEPVRGPMVILDPPSLRAVVPDLDEAAQLRVEGFIKDRRGDDWHSPKEIFDANQDRRCARLQALIDGLPVGDMLELGTHSKRALTGVGRKLRLMGEVGPDMKPIRKQYTPVGRNVLRYIHNQEREEKKYRERMQDMDDDVTSRGLWPVKPSGVSGVTPDELEMLSGWSASRQLAWHKARDEAATSKTVAAPVEVKGPVWQRPHGENGLYWPNMARTLRKVP